MNNDHDDDDDNCMLSQGLLGEIKLNMTEKNQYHR